MLAFLWSTKFWQYFGHDSGHDFGQDSMILLAVNDTLMRQDLRQDFNVNHGKILARFGQDFWAKIWTIFSEISWSRFGRNVAIIFTKPSIIFSQLPRVCSHTCTCVLTHLYVCAHTRKEFGWDDGEKVRLVQRNTFQGKVWNAFPSVRAVLTGHSNVLQPFVFCYRIESIPNEKGLN